MKQTERTWAEIEISALKQNYEHLRRCAGASQFLGICKANAYGHDVTLVAPLLEQWGAEMLGVATVEEGVELRQMGIQCPVLVLGDTTQYSLLVEYDLTQTVHCLSQGKSLNHYGQSVGKKIRIHCKIDTGMGRLGFHTGDIPQTQRELEEVQGLSALEVTGVFSHLSSSEDEGKEYYTTEQRNRFLMLSSLWKKGTISRHLANSGGILFHPSTHLDMVRSGIALYGYSPREELCHALRPVLQLKTRIAVLRSMGKGSSIGYGESAILERDSLIAVLPVGYGDGYPRAYSNRMTVEIGGHTCPIVGKVCMDMTMVDVTGLEVSVGEEVLLYGSQEQLLEGAKIAQTISYELLCQISKRVPRILV